SRAISCVERPRSSRGRLDGSELSTAAACSNVTRMDCAATCDARMSAAVKATARPIPIRRALFLGGVPSIARRAGTGRTQEHLSAVGECDVAPVGAIGAVLGLVAIHDQFSALRQRG